MTPRQRYALEHPVEVVAGAQPGEEFKWAVPAGKTAAVTFMLTVDVLVGETIWHASAALHHVVHGPIPIDRLSGPAQRSLEDEIHKRLAGVGDLGSERGFSGELARHLTRRLTVAEEAELRRSEVAS